MKIATRRPHKRRVNPVAAVTARRAAQYVPAVLVFLVFAGPIYWLITTAFKQPSAIYTFPPVWLPLEPVLDNFSQAWNAAPFGRYAVNSVVVAAAGTVLELAIAILCAYAFAFLRFPAKRVLFGLVLGAMMIPGHVVLLPNYLTASSLGWVNTYAGLIVPTIASVFVTFLLRQHMLTLPREVIDAAIVDGAGAFRRLWSVILPLSRPILATGGIITLITKWNDYAWPLVITNTDSMRTLPIGLAFLRINEGETDWGSVMAGTLMVAAPMLVAYLLAQRHIIAGLTVGATKG